jgi:hypothetical protein
VDNDSVNFPAKLLHAWKIIREHAALNSIGQTSYRPIETESQRKQREILKWKGKRVMWVQVLSGRQAMSIGKRPWASVPVTLIDCTEFYVEIKGEGWNASKSIPMSDIELGRDDRTSLPEIQEHDR